MRTKPDLTKLIDFLTRIVDVNELADVLEAIEYEYTQFVLTNNEAIPTEHEANNIYYLHALRKALQGKE